MLIFILTRVIIVALIAANLVWIVHDLVTGEARLFLHDKPMLASEGEKQYGAIIGYKLFSIVFLLFFLKVMSYIQRD